MQVNTDQILIMLKEIPSGKEGRLGVKLINNPVRSKRPVDNLFAMQNWAMEELWKHLEINKNK
tara:strand:+ start:214 stop:402 length:189 start_codon:yes stop_codon:yes gene_type:complete